MKEKAKKENKVSDEKLKKQEEKNKKQDKIKQKETKNSKNQKETKKGKEKKEKKPNKFIETIKKKWLIDGSKTVLLVAIIIAIFVGINIGMQKLNPTPIDLTQEKLFTLTQGSKDKVKDIDKEVKIYFVEYEDDDSTLDLAKQYSKVNKNITAEAVKANDRPDLVQKYGIQSETQGIIVECGDKSKVLSSSDLVTYDSSTYETISIAEEKLTAAIQSVTTDKVPKVYFLSGYSEISLNSGMQFLNMYLQNEVNEVKSVDVLTTGKVPDDCDVLVITSPSKDFEESVANAIIDYINSGRNILWFQAAMGRTIDTPNINKVLGVYGLNPFEVGIIREGDSDKMLSGSPDMILPEIESTDVTKKLKNSEGLIFVNATKINTMDTDKLTELKVTKTDLLSTSSDSYFRTNFTNTSSSAQEDEPKGAFTVGALMKKTLTEANEETGEKEKSSNLIVYGENYFITDIPLMQTSQAPAVQYRQNKDLALNSIAYLANRDEDIVVRKSTGTVTYTANESENRVIISIIFIVPVVIIAIGIVVWIIRRRRK